MKKAPPKILQTIRVKVNVSFTEEQRSMLRKSVNLHYLGDPECNMMTEGGIVAKYPEKETKEYKEVMHRINCTYIMEVPVHFYEDGTMVSGTYPYFNGVK